MVLFLSEPPLNKLRILNTLHLGPHTLLEYIWITITKVCERLDRMPHCKNIYFPDKRTIKMRYDGTPLILNT